jgi:glutamyl-tRNA reductase
MRVGIMGINHKLADLKLRELLAQACQRRFGAGLSTHGKHYFVLLSTCNRTELYFSSEDLADTHTYLLNIFRNEVGGDFDQKLYSFFGQDCFLHLSRVTAGLDSAVVAETEIQGQVKSSYEASTQFAQLPEDLHYLFQKSLKIGKRIRTAYLFNHNLPEIEHAIYNTAVHFFKEASQIRILFVGVSAINQKVLHFLVNKKFGEITVCNRTNAKCHSLVEEYGVKTLPWDGLANWHKYDCVIFGTKASKHLATSKQLESVDLSSKLVIDLCVPRNVEPSLGRHPQITLLNIDQINRLLSIRKQKLYHMLMQAEEYVLTATKLQTMLFIQKQQVRQQRMAIGA